MALHVANARLVRVGGATPQTHEGPRLVHSFTRPFGLAETNLLLLAA